MDPMSDASIHQTINSLVDEEHQLRNSGQVASDPAVRDRLKQIEDQLDQCWDLLRQRQARREFGEPVQDAQLRSVETVEHYEG